MIGLMPRSIGYQDLVALMARQSEVPQRARAHMMASPFGTIHAATFSFPQPIGSLIPEPPIYQLASIGPYDSDTTGALARDPASATSPLPRQRVDFPAINRRLKGDLLVTRPHDNERLPDGTRDLTPGRVKTVSFPKPADAVIDEAPPAAEPEPPVAALATDTVVADAPKSQSKPDVSSPSYAVASLGLVQREKAAEPTLSEFEGESNAAARLGRLYFGNTISEGIGTIQPWPADEEVLIEQLPANDSDFKRSALASPLADDFNFETSSATPAPDETAEAGETIAAKGEVTGAGKRPKTPAERLSLDGKSRAKSEKCLADAVYFESRGETKRGQIAVAQVVMNRAFSGFYPNSVCGVVYQNSHRKLACQFTFACDGIPDVVKEPEMWKQATEIARDMLDGKLWLPEVGHSTHYHAYWVHPAWVREMNRKQKIGVHSFYRPRAWGDGSEVGPLNQSQIVPQQPAADDAAKAKL